MSTPTSVPTPQDLAARLGRAHCDGTWLGNNLERLQSLAEYLGDRGVTLDEFAEGALFADERASSPSPDPEQPTTHERRRSWSEQETRALLERAETALSDAEAAAVAGEQWAATSRRVEAAVLVGMAAVRGIGQFASAAHRCAGALQDVAAVVRPRGAR